MNACIYLINLKLKVHLVILLASKGVVFIDLGVVRQFTILLKLTCFIRVVTLNNIGLVVLVFTQRDKDNVTLVDPHLFTKSTTNMGKTLHTIETMCF